MSKNIFGVPEYCFLLKESSINVSKQRDGMPDNIFRFLEWICQQSIVWCFEFRFRFFPATNSGSGPMQSQFTIRLLCC